MYICMYLMSTIHLSVHQISLLLYLNYEYILQSSQNCFHANIQTVPQNSSMVHGPWSMVHGPLDQTRLSFTEEVQQGVEVVVVQDLQKRGHLGLHVLTFELELIDEEVCDHPCTVQIITRELMHHTLLNSISMNLTYGRVYL